MRAPRLCKVHIYRPETPVVTWCGCVAGRHPVPHTHPELVTCLRCLVIVEKTEYRSQASSDRLDFLQTPPQAARVTREDLTQAKQNSRSMSERAMYVQTVRELVDSGIHFCTAVSAAIVRLETQRRHAEWDCHTNKSPKWRVSNSLGRYSRKIWFPSAGTRRTKNGRHRDR